MDPRKHLQEKFEAAQAQSLRYLQYTHQEVALLMAERDDLEKTAILFATALQASEATLAAIRQHTTTALDGMNAVKEASGDMPYWRDQATKLIEEWRGEEPVTKGMIQAILTRLAEKVERGEAEVEVVDLPYDCSECAERESCKTYEHLN